MNLWMRWVDFQKLRDLLQLVCENPLSLRSKDLNQLGVKESILVTHQGKPFAATPQYHHRRALERLGLIKKIDDKYVANTCIPELTILSKSGRIGQPLNNTERIAFADLVVRNYDCHSAFFSIFTGEDCPESSVQEFINKAKPVRMQLNVDVDRSHNIRLTQPQSGKNLMFDGRNAIQALHFGIRSWCIDQLNFMDEVFRLGEGHILFSRNIESQVPDDSLEAKLFEILTFTGDWATVAVGDLVLEAGVKFRVPSDQVTRLVEGWINRRPDFVAGIPTSEGFITGGLPTNLKKLALRGFARSRSGQYLSHIQVHRDLARMIKKG